MTRPTSLAGLCALVWAPRYDRSAEAVAAARAWLAAIAAWRGALGLPPGSTFDVAGAVGAPELA
ncbi:MAG TPA: hypothetical protein PKA64_09770, partial [Myxococcota bacterium]|nr:hypothetical protein [Myxococcota bacterium]